MFSECDFSGVNLAESQHRGSAFRNCTFERTTLWHSTFAQCSMLGSVFVACRLRPLTLDDVDFTLAVLGGNDLRGLNLTGCRLRETSLVDTDLRKCVLRGADLSGARTTAPGWMTPTCGARPWTRYCGGPRRWWVRVSTSTKPWPLRRRTGCAWQGARSVSRDATTGCVTAVR